MNIDHLIALLDGLRIETPTWAYAGGEGRWGRFGPPMARPIEQRLKDAGMVQKYTGCCPNVGVHVLWDFEMGVDATQTAELAKSHGLRIGSVSPNLFEDQIYRFGSACSPDERARHHASRHVMDSIAIARAIGSKSIRLMLGDAEDGMGHDDLITRKHRLHGALRTWYDALDADVTLLIEYTPAGDIADWGAAYVYAQDAGGRAKVLVDIDGAAPGTDVARMVAFLLDEGVLGGVHGAGSDPYQLFRIFNEIRSAAELHECDVSGLMYMLEPADARKPVVEGVIQSALQMQEAYAKACLVDHQRLAESQERMDLVEAEQVLREAFTTDVRESLAERRRRHGIDADPLAACRAGAYEMSNVG